MTRKATQPTVLGTGLSAVCGLAQFMLTQYNVQSPFLGGLAFLGMVGAGIYTIWNLKCRQRTRWIWGGIFLLGAVIFWAWLHQRHNQQANTTPVTPLAPPIEQHTEGDNSPTVVGNGNTLNYGNTIRERLDTRLLLLFERYAGEWQGTNDDPIWFRDDEATLRKPFVVGKKYPFTPSVYNFTTDVTIRRMTLFFNWRFQVPNATGRL